MFNLSQRIFPLLQLTRMALVFTAISNSACTLLLAARYEEVKETAGPWAENLRAVDFLLVALISMGLYGFGMSLNDIIDRRRDAQLAGHRPLPSGRVGVLAAHVVCALLGLMALTAGAVYAATSGTGWMSLALVVATGGLIAAYDLAGKYLVAWGLLFLGLIRAFHALIPAQVPLVWHPLLLLNHVTILSLVAYVWEEKRPSLTPIHVWTVLSGLVGIDALAIGGLWWWRAGRLGRNDLASVVDALWIEPMLLLPLAAVAAFIAIGWSIRIQHPNPRQAGAALMLYGLLWLIVYDVSFVLGYVGWVPALALLMLLPVAYASVRLMRWWGQVLTLSQRPTFKRVEP